MYYITSSAVRYKSFDTFHEATEWSNKQPLDSIIEIKYYENSNNNGSTLRS
jgi:hypothetical protein